MPHAISATEHRPTYVAAIVGDEGVGKATFIEAVCNKRFQFSLPVKSPSQGNPSQQCYINYEKGTLSLHNYQFDAKNLTLTNHKGFRLRSPDAYIVAFDKTSMASFENAKKLIAAINNRVYAPNPSPIIILVATKCDANQRFEVDFNTVKDYIEESPYKIHRFLETSAKNNRNIDSFTSQLFDIIHNHHDNPNTLLLNNYLKTRRAEREGKIARFLFWRVGYTQKQKVNAAEALLDVIKGDADYSTLKKHMGALKNGRLGKIVKKHKMLTSCKPIEIGGYMEDVWYGDHRRRMR